MPTDNEWLRQIWIAIRRGGGDIPPIGTGGTGVEPDPDTEDVSPSPVGVSVVNNWRSRLFTPTNTVAGIRAYYFPSPGREYQLLGVFFRLETSATAGDRQMEAGVFFSRLDGVSGEIEYHASAISPYLQPASTEVEYQFSVGLPAMSDPVPCENGLVITAPLPPITICPDYTGQPPIGIKSLVPVTGDVIKYPRLLLAERVIG